MKFGKHQIDILCDRPWALDPSLESLGAVAVLGLFPTALAFLVYFALLGRTGATFLSLINYLIPTFGVLWGVIFLGEQLSTRAAMALGLILAGIAVTRIGMRRN